MRDSTYWCMQEKIALVIRPNKAEEKKIHNSRKDWTLKVQDHKKELR